MADKGEGVEEEGDGGIQEGEAIVIIEWRIEADGTAVTVSLPLLLHTSPPLQDLPPHSW